MSEAMTAVDNSRPPMEHELKTWQSYFHGLADGSKNFELRRDDRDYRPGDTLWLRETEYGSGAYTGRETRRLVTYVLRREEDLGLIDGFAILSLESAEAQLSQALRERDGVMRIPNPTPDQIEYLEKLKAASSYDPNLVIGGPSNPCSKIFDHKWLDPNCVENGCQSLVLQSERDQALRELGEANEAIKKALIAWQCDVDSLYRVRDDRDAALRSTAELRGALERADHTLSVHGHIDAETELHDTIRTALASSSTTNVIKGAELHCDDCQQPYAVWFAPNPIWNFVMGGADCKGDPGGMLCPRCFTLRAEASGMVPTAWEVRPEQPFGMPLASSSTKGEG